jgi:hypothetical protein
MLRYLAITHFVQFKDQFIGQFKLLYYFIKRKVWKEAK